MGYINYANRGMILEEIIQNTNESYIANNVAIIQKVATPIKVLQTNKDKTIQCIWDKKSTVDFIGNYKGIPIAFDTKETKEINKVPLSSIRQHQIEFLSNWKKQNNSVAFIIIYFVELHEFYMLDIDEIKNYIQSPYKKYQKSIPREYIKKAGQEMKMIGMRLDYLKYINKANRE